MAKEIDTHTGRVIVDAFTFEPDGTFGAFSKAARIISEMGYTVGSMCRDEPIGFADVEYIGKWNTIKRNEHSRLIGIIIPLPEFREGGVRVIFFKRI